MSGQVTGLDFGAGFMRVDTSGLDKIATREIAAQGEIGLLKGLAEREKD